MDHPFFSQTLPNLRDVINTYCHSESKSEESAPGRREILREAQDDTRVKYKNQ